MTDYRRLVEEENPYLDLIRQEQTEAVRSAMYGAAQTEPDVEAELRRLAEKVNVPVETVRADREEIKRQAILGEIDYDNLVKSSPVTATFLSEQADVARDDVSTLERIERTFIAPRQGYQQSRVMDAVFPLNWKAASGAIMTAAEMAERQRLNLQISALGQTPERKDNPIAWAFGEIGAATGQFLTSLREGGFPGAAVGAAVGAGTALALGQAGPQVALPEELVTVPGGGLLGARKGFVLGSALYSYKQETGFAFAEYEGLKDENGVPLDPAVARGAAATVGLLNAALDTASEIKLLRAIPGVDRLLELGSSNAVKQLLRRPTFRAAVAQAGKQWLEVASVEGLTEAIQEVIVILGRELAQGVSGQEFAADEGDVARVLEAGAAGFVGGAGLGLPGSVIAATSNVREVRKANQTAQFMEALGESAKASKLRERLPEQFRDFVARAREQGPIENVFIPADQFTQYWQSQNVDPAQVAAEVGASNYAEAVATGSDVVIPIENYATRLAPTEHHAALSQDAKLFQGDLTLREVEALEAERQQVEAEIQTAMETEGAEAEAPAIDQIKQDVLGQLLGRFDRQTADAYATLYTRAINALAQRSGIDPAALHEQYGLSVVTPLPDILQARMGVDAALDPLIDRLRAGEVPTQRDIFGKSLTQFLRERGGLQDQGGELAARDAKLWDRDNRRVGEKALVSDKGMTFDQAREIALEAGYEVGDTEVTFLGALDREFRGEPVFMPGKEQPKLAELADALAGLEEFLGRQGIDVTTTDNATIKALIAKASEGMGDVGQQFDQSATIRAGRELFQSVTGRDGAQAPRLMAINNLSADNLLFADRMGGLAVPSIGVITEQGGGVEGFGEITLIGTKDLADPSAEPVFSSDAYTARFPKPEWPKAKSKDVIALIDSVRALAKEFDDRLLVDMTFDEMVNSPDAEKVIERWVSSQAAQAMFLREQGVDVTPVMRQKPTRSGFPVEVIEALRPVMEGLNIGMSANDILDSPQVAALPQAYAEAMTAYFVARGVAPEDSAQMIDRRASFFSYSTIDRLLTDLSANLGLQEVDSLETRNQLEPLINERAVEFKQWVEDKILPNFGDPFLKVGGKKVPYTLGNIVMAMTDTKLRGNEKTITYGAGQVRAATNIKFSDIEQMRKAAASSVVDVDEYEQAKKKSEALLDAYRTSVIEFTKLRNWRGAPDTWEAMDASMRALAKWGTGKKRDAASLRAALRGEDFDVAQIPDDVIEQGIKAGNALLSAPVPYFEAKPQRAVKLNEFAGAVIPANASDKVREVLQRNGVPFVEYADQEQRMQAARDFAGQLSAQGNQGVLFQTDEGDKRGFIQFGADRKVRIGLLEKADLSTFIHETGHFYLEVLLDLAERPDASEQIKADAATLMKWFKVKNRSEIGVAQHEQFARGNEAYLMEGAAPSAALRGIFQRARAWMTLLYRTLTRLNVTLNDEVRGVFDRIYATDQEIEAANAELDLKEVFATAEDAGMTEAEFAAYKKSAESANERAKEKLQAQMLREYSREREKWWKGERAKMLEKVTAEVDASPAYRAAAILTEGKMPDGTAIKLSRKALENRFGEEYLKRLPRFLRKVYSKEDGTTVDVAAEMLGFESGEALMEALVNLRPRKQLIEAEVANRMAAEFGDMRMDGTIGDEAMAAVHNSQRAKVIEAELMAIRRLQRQVRPVIAGLRRAEAAERRAGLDMVAAAIGDPGAFQRAAAGRIGQMMARDVSPGRYLIAQRRASKAAFDAVKAKDYAKAATEKQRELLNHYMYLEALKAQKQLDTIYAYAGKFDKKATRERLAKAGGGYLDQIDAILEKYEFRQVSMRMVARRQALADFAEQQAQLGLIVNVPDALLDEARLVNYKDVPVDELRAVYDTVRNIEHLARLKDKLLRKQAAVEFQDVKDELIKSATESTRLASTGELAIPNTVGEPLRARGAKAWRRFDAAILKVEQMVEWLDNGKIGGPWARFVFDLANDAQVKEYELHAQVTKRIQDLTESQPKGWGDTLQDTFSVALPGIQSPVTRYTLISIALNTGNDGNYQRLRDGYGWSDTTINGALAKLSKEDWDYVQGIWDAVNSLWPEIKALEERTSGVAPPKVEARTVQTRFGDYAGGYFPLAYDPRLSGVGDKQAEATESVAQFMSNAYGRARTDKGYTKQRVENLKAPVRLDYEQVLTSHLGKVIKDISHREAIFSLNKLLKDDEIKEVMIDRLGEARYREFTKWMQVLVSDRADTLHSGNVFSRAVMQFRTNMAIVTMGWKVTTMMAQFAGVGPALDVVKPRFFTQALIDYNRFGPWSTHRETLEQFVYDRSGEMKFRSDNIDRDVRDSLRKLRGDRSPLAAIRRSAFYLTAMADRQVTVPTWLAAYRQAQAEGLGEEDSIRAGDRAVRLSQGAAGAKDLAAVQRDNELMKLLTMYYTPFSVLYARMRDVGATTRKVKDMPRAVARMLALVILPAVLGEILAGRGPEEDEDETWWAIRKMLLYPLASVPILKEGSGVVEASMINLAGEGEMKFQPSWRLTPVAGSIEKVGRTFMNTSDVLAGNREFNDVAWDVFETSGYIFGLPTRQLRISGEYTMDVLNDERNPESPQQFMYEVLYGPPKE